MNDSKLFDEISSRFFTGLTEDQLAGKREFAISEQLSGLRISHQSRFDAKAEEILEFADKSSKAGDTPTMNDITREEFNARMETIEVKMDARVEAVSAKIDGFLAAQAERDKRLDDSVANIRGDIARLGSLKLNIWGAMLTAVGIGIAVAALSVTFYQTGKADSPSASSQQQTSVPQSTSPTK